MTRLLAPIVLLFALLPGFANEPVDWETVSLIRNEALNNSQVMTVLHHLTDKIGSRLTNSPSMKTANEYTKTTLQEWGVSATLEPWGPFGRGWSYTHASLQMKTPKEMPIFAIPKAWTPGTDGPITAPAYYAGVEKPEDLEALRGKLAGKIVLVDPTRAYEHKTEASFERYSHQALDDMCQLEPEGEFDGSRYRSIMALEKALRSFLKEEGAVAGLYISSRDDGILRVMGGGSYEVGSDPGVPSLVLGAEQYNMISRKLIEKEPVELTLHVTAQFHDEDPMGYNTIGEIVGGDLKDQIVMTGAHLDSWHAAGGALDNGVGVAVAMEAMRILKAIGVKPRRTIQIGLWSGEEQGLFGSKAHVEKHYADFVLPEGVDASKLSRWEKSRLSTPVPKPDHKDFSVYFNLDNGGGKIRGIYTQGNAGVVPIFKEWMEPFKDMGSGWVTVNDTGGTDHQSFDAAGLPGFQFIQDPLSYSTKNHHTNLDVYDHVIEADLQQAAAVMASFVYHAAMRDTKLPRKPMPKPEKPKPTEKPSTTTPAAASPAPTAASPAPATPSPAPATPTQAKPNK